MGSIDIRQFYTTIEQFVGLNLNPASDDFIAKRIGNQELTWNDSEKKYKINGQYPNLSSAWTTKANLSSPSPAGPAVRRPVSSPRIRPAERENSHWETGPDCPRDRNADGSE